MFSTYRWVDRLFRWVLGHGYAVFRVSMSTAIASAVLAAAAAAWPSQAASAPGGTLPAVAGTVAPAEAVTYAMPLPPPVRVLRVFVAPATAYGPGHRGVDLSAHEGEPVAAAAGGVVTVAGVVAGRGLVVVQHADGVLTEYEPLSPSVRAGQVVEAGEGVGTVHGTHAAFAEGACLHWGARRGDSYIDPLSLLQPLGVVRLLPLDPTAG